LFRVRVCALTRACTLLYHVCILIVGSGGVGHGHHCRIEKGRGVTDIIAKLSVHGFPAAVDPEDRCRRTTPLLPSRQSSSLLVPCYPPLGRLDRNGLVGKQRAPFPGAASRLSAASSNTLHLPLTHPYPLCQQLFHRFCPRLLVGIVFESILSR
jgi:hypothetical protein